MTFLSIRTVPEASFRRSLSRQIVGHIDVEVPAVSGHDSHRTQAEVT